MKFIHIADVNLGAQPDSGRIWSDVRSKEIYSTFHRVIEVCEEQKIELYSKLLMHLKLKSDNPLLHKYLY